MKRDEAECKRFKRYVFYKCNDRLEDEKKKYVDESIKVNKGIKDKKEKDQPTN